MIPDLLDANPGRGGLDADERSAILMELDDALAAFSGRSILPADEVTDRLLDLRRTVSR